MKRHLVRFQKKRSPQALHVCRPRVFIKFANLCNMIFSQTLFSECSHDMYKWETYPERKIISSEKREVAGNILTTQITFHSRADVDAVP